MEKGRVIVPPGRTGEPFTGRRGTGDQIVGSHEVREMRKSHTGTGSQLQPGSCDIGHWRAVMRSKDSRPVLRGAVGKALTFGEWLAGGLLYFTLRSVVGAGVERPQPTITYRDACLH